MTMNSSTSRSTARKATHGADRAGSAGTVAISGCQATTERHGPGIAPVSLMEMDREQAQRERDRMAAQHPEATWLLAERDPGAWEVVGVGLTPPDRDSTEAIEERPVPAYADDPRNSLERDRGGPSVGPG